MGVFSGFAPAFYVPLPNVTVTQWDAFFGAQAAQGKSAAGLASMTFPYIPFNHSQWQEWSASPMDQSIVGSFGDTLGEVRRPPARRERVKATSRCCPPRRRRVASRTTTASIDFDDQFGSASVSNCVTRAHRPQAAATAHLHWQRLISMQMILRS